jgi:hypothetical protein
MDSTTLDQVLSITTFLTPSIQGGEKKDKKTRKKKRV